MPETRYRTRLEPEREEENYLRVWIRTERGTVVDFVAQYEAILSDLIYPVVRYDGSHGRGHRDLLDRHGETIRKTWFPEEMSLADVLTFGIKDIVTNWRTYREEFLEREDLPGGIE